MALGVPASVTTTTGAGSTPATTSSFTVASGSTIFVCAIGNRSASLLGAMSISDSVGLSWTQVLNGTHDPGSGTRLRLQVWRATSTGASMTVTITGGSPTPVGFAVQVVSVSGAATTVTNAASAGNAAGDPAPSLSSVPSTASTVLGFCLATSVASLSPPTDYTELHEFLAAASQPLQTVYDAGSAAQSATWSSTGGASIAGLLEVRVAPYLLAADPSSLTLSATPAALRATRKMVADPATLTLTGSEAALRHRYTLAAESGTLSLVAGEATFRRTYALIGTPASLSLTGTPAALRRRVRLHAEPGILTLTALPVDLVRRLGFEMDSGPPSFAFTPDTSPTAFTFTKDDPPPEWELRDE